MSGLYRPPLRLSWRHPAGRSDARPPHRTETRMQAIVLSIGDELVLGQTADTNSAWVSARLAERGIPTHAHQTVADDRKAIELAIRWACHNAGLVIVSGGLGPTEDDLTRFALADALGVELVEDADAVAGLEAFFRARGRPMPQRNRIQAMFPAGTSPILNPHGTAPGIRAHVDRAEVFVVPGVPREMRPMITGHVVPFVGQHAGISRTILTTKVNTFGAGESTIAELLGDLMSRDRNPVVGTTVAQGIVSVRIRSEFDEPSKAQQELATTRERVESVLGPLVFGRDEQTLQEAVVALLADQGTTVTTAESCTGGLVGAMLTDVPGSSAVYRGGWVTYSNAMKAAQLGVSQRTLADHGAVSGPVVEAMALGALERSGADLAMAVSGIAGPDGGTPDKPVGTVWFALAQRRVGAEPRATTRMALLPGERASVRDRAAKCALQWLRLHALGEPVDQLGWLVASQTPDRPPG